MRQYLEDIDRGKVGYLVVCSCGWREISLGNNKGRAWTTAANHAAAVHSQARNARDAAIAAGRRGAA